FGSSPSAVASSLRVSRVPGGASTRAATASAIWLEVWLEDQPETVEVPVSSMVAPAPPTAPTSSLIAATRLPFAVVWRAERFGWFPLMRTRSAFASVDTRVARFWRLVDRLMALSLEQVVLEDEGEVGHLVVDRVGRSALDVLVDDVGDDGAQSLGVDAVELELLEGQPPGGLRLGARLERGGVDVGECGVLEHGVTGG